MWSHGEMELKYHLLTSVLDGGKRTHSRPGHVTPGGSRGYGLNKRLCTPQRWFRPFGNNMKLFPLLRIKTLFFGIPFHYTNWATPAPSLCRNVFSDSRLYTLLYILQTTQLYNKSIVKSHMFRLKSHRQAKLRTMKFFTMWLCAFGIPDGSQCVLWFVPCI